jgi:D-3-phosphoglycerate dehydrogenase / 2-oxoglutarate reductase
MIVVLDFDSTFIKAETIDVMARCNGESVQTDIAFITEQAMNGELDFGQALAARLALLQLNRAQLQQTVDVLTQQISPSILANQDTIKRHAQSIYIVSGGFGEVILPIVQDFGIIADHVFANDLQWDTSGHLCGVDQSNPLSKKDGKVHVLSQLSFTEELIIVGDGYTDYEVKQAGVANQFWAYTENVRRQAVVALADRVIGSFNECIELLGWNE